MSAEETVRWPELDRVVLAISSYRNDSEVIRLLQAACPDGHNPFARIVVVDSLGTGAIEAAIKRKQLPKVIYTSATRNLGSAGNMGLRLRIAAGLAADYVFTVNHDGSVSPPLVARLLRFAESRKHLGAAYPLRYLSSRGTYDISGQNALPMVFRGSNTIPTEGRIPVRWSSNNGALYALEPVRRGILPLEGLWHGADDYDLGIQLHRAGYQQFIVTSALSEDNYEYRAANGTGVLLNDKPSWMMYYLARNMMLIWRVRKMGLWFLILVLMRILKEILATLIFRGDKRARLSFLALGSLHGALGGEGKWYKP